MPRLVDYDLVDSVLDLYNGVTTRAATITTVKDGTNQSQFNRERTNRISCKYIFNLDGTFKTFHITKFEKNIIRP